jgi:nucleoid-associated protein YgaU
MTRRPPLPADPKRATTRPGVGPGGPPMGGTRRALQATGAVIVLLALCAGIPLALLTLTSTSFPRRVPTMDSVLHGLTGGDDGTLFLAVLTLAAWAGWATFVVAVLVEIPAQVRGVPPLRVRGLGAQQTLAGGLVAAALAVVLVPTAASAAERPVSAVGTRARPVVAAAPATPGKVSALEGAREAERPHVSSPQADVDRAEYLVRPGDTLWDIAAARLGDGAHWRQIAALNYGRPQPDGDALDRDHVLRPGWRLALPAASGPVHQRVVRAGDTLSAIAEEELGDAGRYPDLVRATEPLLQPSGVHLTDADVIYPGWRIEVPEDGGRVSPPAGSAPAARVAPRTPPSTAPPGVGPAPTPASVTGTGPLDPGWGAVGSPTQGVGHSAAAAVAVPPGSGVVEDAGGTDAFLDEILEVRTLAGTGGLLAACLLLLLSARRARQQRLRRPGERLPMPAEAVQQTESRLRAVADRAAVESVDLALRALAAEHRAAGRPLPSVRSARLTASHLELYLTEVANLSAPWVATSDPTVWAMTHDELSAQLETDTRAPFPSLVTVGQDLEGAHVLVDLEQLTALAIEGTPEETLPLLAAMAVELGTSLPELPETVASGRLRHVERVEQLIADLEGRARDVERVLRDAGVDDLASARGKGVADDAWSPEIVLLADDVPSPLRERLEHVLYQVPHVGLAAVTSGTALGEWRLRLGDAGLARLDPVGLTLRPQRLVGEEYEDVLDLLRTADADPVPGPTWAAAIPSGEPALAALKAPSLVPPPVVATIDVPSGVNPIDGEPAQIVDEASASGEGADAGVMRLRARPPYVRLLGKVEVLHAAGPEPVSLKDGKAVASHLGRATALVAYLACRPQGATVDQVAEALSPVRRLSPSTIWSLASRTRKWLGSDADGDPYFPRTSDAGSNRLHPAVRTDWQDWLDLVGADAAATPTPHLVQALALVRGRPFEGVSERHFAWAEPLRQDILAGVVDVAHEVARRALEIPDAALARKAATVGRIVDPANEMLWRDALRAEYVAGSREGQRRLVEQVYALADDLESDLEPETEQLIAELDRWSTSRAAR